MSSKRKAASSAVEIDTPDSKRQKVPPPEAETAQSTTTAGLTLLENIRQTRDKRGRLIAIEFLTLPNKDIIPQYFEEIILPVALDTIEAKLRRYEYPTLTTVESDLKRMISNAKVFNEKNSEIHNDAEKMRKSINGKMRAINPAYQNPDYMAFPTPLPDEENADATEADGDTQELAPEPVEQKKPRLKLGAPSAPKEEPARVLHAPAARPAIGIKQSLTGKSFQQAQEQVIAEMMDLEDEDGERSISGPFVHLPPRTLLDYYQVIKHPSSLKQVEKKIRGVKGKERGTGISLYKTWQAMEEDMVRIWENARIYNEDGSEISEMASELEKYFIVRIAEAKEAVKEPSAPSIKLRLGQKDVPQQQPPQKIRLNMGRPIDAMNGVAVDHASKQRLQEFVAAGANGYAPSPTSAISGATRSGSAASPPIVADGIKLEHSATRSPAPQMVRNGSTGSGSQAASISMPPPASTTPRLPSGSPHPQIHRPPPPPAPVNAVDQRMRGPGKGAKDALITNLVIRTHPGLNIDDRFRLSIPPSPKLTQQSVTVNLPHTHHSLIIEPTFATVPMYRQGKPIITLNDYPVRAISVQPEEDPHNHSWEARVRPGMNKIDVEMITGPVRGAPKVGNGPEIEYEKTTIFVNLFN